MTRQSKWQCAAAAALAAGTLLLFGPVVRYGFVNYDDDYHILENPLIRSLGPRNLVRMFTQRSVTSYYPVRALSWAIDFRFWGADPRGYHLTNVLLHTANVLLVFLLCGRLLAVSRQGAGGAAGRERRDAGAAGSGAGGGGGKRRQGRRAARARRREAGKDGRRPRREPTDAARGPEPPGQWGPGWDIVAACLAAALFALHPVVVEPVAWISGREELLMTGFVLLGILVHSGRSARAKSGAARPSGPTVVFGLLAALSSVLGVVFPALITAYVLCFGAAAAGGWRERARAALGRTWLLWLVAAAVIVIKIHTDRLPDPQGDVKKGMALSIGGRALTVLNLYRLNVGTVLAPHGLAAPYPNTVPGGLAEWGVWVGLVLAAATVFAACARRTSPLIRFGLWWFGVALAPSSQVIPHHIFRGDRFLYLPLAGLAAGVCLGLLSLRDERRYRAAGAGLLCAALVPLIVVSARQVGVWRDAKTLFSHTLTVYPRNAMAHNNLAIALTGEGRLEEAVRHYRAALAEIPDYADAHYNLANVLGDLGRVEAAIHHYSRNIAIRPYDAEGHNNLGVTYSSLGRYDEAIQHYRAAVRARPSMVEAQNNLGVDLARRGRYTEAVEHYRKAIAYKPDFVDAHNNLGVSLFELGRVAEAIAQYSVAVQLNPRYAEAHSNLGIAFMKQGRYAAAAAAFSACRQLVPGNEQVEKLLREAEGRLAIDD
ncbi:MAG: tetratricopeptide repeat protein [Kiritimatiellae bacterium]|nr:tetratricopeptide repeat protein [Kiritimatiellia bacterium]